MGVDAKGRSFATLSGLVGGSLNCLSTVEGCVTLGYILEMVPEGIWCGG